jgi:hypothetical protein
VDKAITTQDQIDGRERLPSYVQEAKFNTGSVIEHSVCSNYVRNDIGPNVMSPFQVNVTHPVEVTTWKVKQRSYAKFRN